ncbi:hypothetical protein MTO98_33430 [Mucilaginibacter sp. SMC90]|uniref:hypothetical protein n=1 Tax=Mucilaginibacter sp. SMC90 TaxID=2929803 RepID=UPI001FB36864|nr:hypothetical protein [Mucilaginibacter sp. SMC90]UOE49298.1 hypothetical protein MTO98_33430 [Mucilaginibacter sp. SMC90]
MKQFLLAALAVFSCCSNDIFAQVKLDGVYAGCEFSPSPIFGGGMNRRDVAVMFRPDGTFNDVLNRADWQTNVSGKYTVNNNEVNLKYTKSSSVYTITKYGSLSNYAHELFKLQGNVIPAGYYSFISAMGGGGAAYGTTYVGALSTQGLNFDGQGHFSNSRYSGSVVAGENVGGGSSSSKDGRGTYKINKGVLTLTYTDGHTELHSFFCDMGGKTRMAVVDGRVFFVDNNDQATNNDVKPSTTAKNAQEGAPANTGNTAVPDGKTLLLKANAIHGGDKLNALKTARLTGSVSGLKVVELIDITNSKVRVEVWKNSKPVSVQQTEGNTGWQWSSGNKSDLPANSVAEVKTALYTGVIGLRKSLLDQMQIVNTQKIANNNMYTVQCKLNGNEYVFAVNDKNQLMAYGYKVGDKTLFSMLSDLRPVQGITIPYHEATTSGQQKLNIQYDSMDVNPVLDEQSWAVPAGN